MHHKTGLHLVEVYAYAHKHTESAIHSNTCIYLLKNSGLRMYGFHITYVHMYKSITSDMEAWRQILRGMRNADGLHNM